MSFKRIVVIGASSGGIEALRTVVSALPVGFPAPICIVMHLAPQSPGLLHEILSRSGPLDAVSPKGGERLRAGTIYVAPPDLHLLVEPGRVRLTRAPRENRFRPAIDPLFRSAAQSYGPAAIGVILTGNLDDGTAGLAAIKQLGGTAVVQSPDDALFPSMPESAIANVAVDHVVPLADVAALLNALTSELPTELMQEVPLLMDVENRIAKDENPLDAGLQSVSRPSTFSCPECHGVLQELIGAKPARFRCHTGHAYSVEGLVAAVNQAVEDAMWSAIRAMQEASLLLERVSDQLHATHPDTATDSLQRRVRETRTNVELMRKMLDSREALAAQR